MTISSTANRVSYNGNGVTTAFSFPYLFYANDDLTVILVDEDGVETVQTITTDYTVTGAGVGAGGTVTMVVAPATGEKLVILREVDYDQQDFDPTDNDPFPAGPIEQVVDTVVMMAQQLKEIADRSLRFPRGDSTSLTSQIPPAVDRANKALIFDADGNVTVSEDDYEDQAADAAASAAAAAASASAASTSASNASTSASNAATSATNAASSATSAAASAALAASTLASTLWRGTRRLTSADSPYTVVVSADPDLTDNGRLLVCDTGSAAITISLPAIAGNTPFNIGVLKDTADGNAVTINRNGTDTIDGATSKVLSGGGAGCELIADASATPDEWEVLDFGAATYSRSPQYKTTGDGVTTGFTLSVSPGSEDAIDVYFDGVHQNDTVYSVSGTTLTFATAPGNGVGLVVTYQGQAVGIGVPGDGTVTTAKLANGAVTAPKLGTTITPQGRLTLTSGTPVLTTGVTGATTIYYTPYVGNLASIYDGSWLGYAISEISLALDSDSGHTGYHQSGKNFDLFLISDAGTVRLGTGPAWSSDTARGSGAGTTEITRLNGLWVNANTMTVRFGSASGNTVSVSANRATYVGTFRASANGQTEFSFGGAAANGTEAKLFLWNAYNRVGARTRTADTTDNWAYTTGTIRAANNSSTMRASFVVGLNEDPIRAAYHGASTTSSSSGSWGVGLDLTSGFNSTVNFSAVNFIASAPSVYDDRPGLGFHFVSANEFGATGTTFFGDNGGTLLQTALTLNILT